MNNAASALIFTGQGGQYTGMGKTLYETSPEFKMMVDSASSISGRDIAALLFSAGEDELRDPLNSQLVTFVYEVGIFELMKAKELLKDVELMAGHSIGEYAALYAADCVTYENALKLILKRSELCKAVNEKAPAAMLTVLGANENELNETFKTCEVYPALINSPSQVVISGLKDNISKAKEHLASEYKKRSIILNVAGGYHTPLMQDAFDDYKEILNNTLFTNGKYQVIANTTASPIWRSDDIFDELRYQLIEPVKWHDSMEYLYTKEDIRYFVEIGPKPVLLKMFKDIHDDIHILTVSE
ncbi:MAG: ACP S-malonyltransferase [Dehalococcoidales bacterium]|nr:ACP S-malonyltransferase [Dehalococcoidales bacterium]